MWVWVWVVPAEFIPESLRGSPPPCPLLPSSPGWKADTCPSPAASRSQDHFGHENWDHQLKLAVAWNRVDIARSEIFTDQWQWKVSPVEGLTGPSRALLGSQARPWGG